MLVNGLVYPLPHPSGHGLGVHLDENDRRQRAARTSIRYQVSRHDYENDRLPLEAFVEPARQMLPELTDDDLRWSAAASAPSCTRPRSVSPTS